MSDLCNPEKPLIDKLGIKPGLRISLLGIRDSDFLRQVLPQVANPSQHRAVKGSDLIFLGVESKEQLQRLAPLRKYLVANGNIWVIYPKGQKHITQADVMAAIKEAGLVDNKTCSFSVTHTGLRACIPLAMRGGNAASTRR
ncbi:DUF3052 family protein [Bryobacter aggregatus]|uniref:DUF3052 family protein n=1 Tax=Bryobacter aggregatus TaxID=360054 RepID=UPI0004E1571B|nr:DUF3052 family protein [Bryobacter aggregatus]